MFNWRSDSHFFVISLFHENLAKMKRDAINFEEERVPVLFRKILIPTLLGTISISAVTAIDGIFIGHGVGADGVAAVNIVVPIYQLISGIGLMVGAGCSVVASIHLSKRNLKVARLNVTQAMVLTTLFVALLCLLMGMFPYQTAKILGSSDTLMPQVYDYLIWILPAFLFDMWSMIGLFIIRLDGSPRFAMWCNVVPAVLNAFLDWLFIFPLGMGVKGAALLPPSVSSWAVSWLWCICFSLPMNCILFR